MTVSAMLVLTLSGPSPVVSGSPFNPVTRVPVIYVIDYGIGDRAREPTLAAYAKAPPDIVHTSKFGNYSFRGGPTIALGTQDELTQMVGERDTVLLSVPEVPETVIAALCALDGVDHCIPSDEGNGDLRLLAADGRAVLPDMIRIINDAGLSLRSVEIQEPTLEAVFLHLTGRALRD